LQAIDLGGMDSGRLRFQRGAFPVVLIQQPLLARGAKNVSFRFPLPRRTSPSPMVARQLVDGEPMIFECNGFHQRNSPLPKV
jgi:hypothetical protein